LSAARYNFDTIFAYDSARDVIVPKYDVTLNGSRFPRNVPISKDPNSPGIVLFRYLGRDINGFYDQETGVLKIDGFY
jgi:hypothetical protein